MPWGEWSDSFRGALSFWCLVVCLFDVGVCIHYVDQVDPELAVLLLQPSAYGDFKPAP